MPVSDGGEVRAHAIDILVRVERDEAWAGVLLASRESGVRDPRDRALLHMLVLGVLRRLPALDAIVSRVSSRPPRRLDPDVRAALRVGILSLLYLDRVPDFAAVSPVVDALRRRGPGVTGFVNGVLRRVARERGALIPPDPDHGDVPALANACGHPEWWTRRVVRRVGWDGARSLLEANNRPAPTVLRPDCRKPDVDHLPERLADEGVQVEASPWAPRALRVVAGAPQHTAAFHDGRFWIQEEASQLVPALLGAEPGNTVLDACAAPGGKTLVLAEAVAPEGRVIAVDIRPDRMARLLENVTRVAPVGVSPVVADLTRTPPFVAGCVDAALVDAPCSGTGTLRRHPEIRWRLSPDDLPALARRQRGLLEQVAGLVRPGGSVVYSVCSMEPEEGPEVVDAFLAEHPTFEPRDPCDRLPEPCHDRVGADLWFRTAPDAGGMDGFQAIVLERAAPSSRER